MLDTTTSEGKQMSCTN